jgi:hypothetical protein
MKQLARLALFVLWTLPVLATAFAPPPPEGALSPEEAMAVSSQFDALKAAFDQAGKACDGASSCIYESITAHPDLDRLTTPWGTPVQVRFYTGGKLWVVSWPDLTPVQCRLLLPVLKAHGAPATTTCDADRLRVFYRYRPSFPSATLPEEQGTALSLQFDNIRDTVGRVREACGHDAGCVVTRAPDFAWIALASTPWGTEVNLTMDLQTSAFVLSYPGLTPGQCKVARALFAGLDAPKNLQCESDGLRMVFP